MKLLEGKTRFYAWGSRTLIPQLRGENSASDNPEAEIWFGAHPGAPSTINGMALNKFIGNNTDAELGERVAERFGGQLPFLLKVLAAGSPLSLQAHPSLKQAKEGFARENAADIDLQASNRNYRDENHKPELVVALTDFIALAGFRPRDRTLRIFDVLDCKELNQYREILINDSEEEGLRALFTSWIEMREKDRSELIDSLLVAAGDYLSKGSDEEIKFVLKNLIELNCLYPHDVGVLGALLLNLYKLSPGEAIYLDAGNLHAYISGLAVEIMANSDNVLRGGLTSKHIDAPELVSILDFNSLENAKIEGLAEGSTVSYQVQAEEFILERVALDGTHIAEHDGPMIILCTKGQVTLRSVANTIILTPGDAAWISASDTAVKIDGVNAEVFLASV